MVVVQASERTPRPLRTTTAVPLGVAALGGALLLWGRSYPGFPVSLALAAVLCAGAALLLGAGARRRVATTAAVVVTLGVGVAAAALVEHRALHARWSASTSDFEAYVAVLPAPASFAVEESGASFHPFPSGAACPARLGRVALGRCVSVDAGYLFLQAPDALTDSSGIAYLPTGNDAARTGLDPHDLTPLGGPWWSWTCHC